MKIRLALLMVGCCSWLGCTVSEDEVQSCQAAADHLAACGLPSAKAEPGADVCIGEFAEEILDYDCDELAAAVESKAEGFEPEDACDLADLCVNSFYFAEETCTAIAAACTEEAKAESGGCSCNTVRDRCLKPARRKKDDGERKSLSRECRSEAADCRDDCGSNGKKNKNKKKCGQGKKWSNKKNKCVKKKKKDKDKNRIF